ncbi:unnamed protein product [Rotaria socialis]|uniref:PiggyBac transposable element-derived protein domain-containing protein n=2 Tax=Rotaria socialis TaxID=392032 RepID=A0A820XZX4_9BILA|nr:unnamed protein product [Rotaria socialis]CAF4538965.1 unnamed protein product [Rotaria socialis]
MKNHQLFFDNSYFTSLQLLYKLRRKKVSATGTICSDRKYFPTKLKKGEKLERSDYRYLTSNGVSVIKWMDKKEVFIASNYFDPAVESEVSRRDKDGNRKQISCPLAIVQYNKYMGDVDLSDQKIKYYTIDRKSKRNWMRIFFHFLVNIPANAIWKQNGVTIAGGNVGGGATNKLNNPGGLFVDDDETVVIADLSNHRIMQWKNGDITNGQVVAGGKGRGDGLHQLNCPTDVLIDKETDSLIICDPGNRRVVRWSRHSGTTQGEVLIGNIACWGLAMDKQRYLYVSDYVKHEIRRYQLGEKNGTLAAGGNGKGNGLSQLNVPRYLFVDRQQNVYISDNNNHRVMKWNKGAKEGIVVAGGQGVGNALTQLSHPDGIFVDTLDTLYVADSWNHRVMRWTPGDKKRGTVIVGVNGGGKGENQLSVPFGLSFDRQGRLYVADNNNDRIQRFSIE